MHFPCNAGSRIIENNLEIFPLFLAPEGSSNPAGPFRIPFSKPTGQGKHLLNLTYPKII